MLQDLDVPPVPGPGQAVALPRADSRITVFHGKGNESAARGRSELVLLQDKSSSKHGGPHAFKTN